VRLVVDANIFVGELLRRRGKELIGDEALSLIVSQSASEEARYEIPKRFAAMVERVGMSRETADALIGEINEASRKVRVIPEKIYRDRLEEARERIPRDPDDAPTVALALALGEERAGIWTMDGDFLGCGIPVWTTETLRARLSRIRKEG
jgi:predicted nucleic acid-binding protein